MSLKSDRSGYNDSSQASQFWLLSVLLPDSLHHIRSGPNDKIFKVKSHSPLDVAVPPFYEL